MIGRKLGYKEIIGFLAGIAAIVSFILAGTPEIVRKIILALWIVLPPTWFFWEYCFLTDEEDKMDDKKFSRLKYSQDLASKIWAAIATVLAALYFGDKLSP